MKIIINDLVMEGFLHLFLPRLSSATKAGFASCKIRYFMFKWCNVTFYHTQFFKMTSSLFFFTISFITENKTLQISKKR